MKSAHTQFSAMWNTCLNVVVFVLNNFTIIRKYEGAPVHRGYSLER